MLARIVETVNRKLFFVILLAVQASPVKEELITSVANEGLVEAENDSLLKELEETIPPSTEKTTKMVTSAKPNQNAESLRFVLSFILIFKNF